MRWDGLRVGESGPALFGEDDVVVRTFDTPRFRGITFYEVRARSILNRVPKPSRVPFGWTINPYRGCSHACVYCLAGDTPILMADGQARPLADLRTGDRVYGTVQDGRYRRYAITEILAHWQTTKPAYRIRLADGTVLVASADHRFLTRRGWKYVTGVGSGSGRRPCLTTNDKLLGFGRLREMPVHCAEYRRGYLTGLIRGDGHVGTYQYDRPGRANGVVHRFRLALADPEPLRRVKEYLDVLGLPTTEFVFAPQAANRRAISTIRSSAAAAVESIRQLIQWPMKPSRQWSLGFLAGIFDAEGSYSQGTMRIANTKSEIIDQCSDSLTQLGFRTVVEDRSHANGLRYVRIRGGLPEALRFFHMTDTAIERKRSIVGAALKSDAALHVLSIEPLGIDMPMYDITTGTGDFIANGVVSHNCFARNTHTYLEFDSGKDFDTQIVVKINAAERLRQELAAPKWTGEHVAMGTNVDCYQRAEGRYALMPGILTALRDAENPFSILTKGSLILRDLPILREAAAVTSVALNVSIGLLDRELWRSVEPGTPSPRRRLQVVRELTDAGLRCGVLMAPVLPFLTDSPQQLDAAVREIAAAGAESVTPIVLHLRTGAREWYIDWLRRTHPEVLDDYRALYGHSAYADGSYQTAIREYVEERAAHYGLRPMESGEARKVEPPQPVKPEPTQLRLV